MNERQRDFPPADKTIGSSGVSGNVPPDGNGRANGNGNGRRWPLIVLLILVVVGGAYGGYEFVYSLSHESTDDAFLDGTIVRISPRVAGHVARVVVKANQPVKKGDALLEIDARPFQAKVDQAKAALEVARAARKVAHTKVDLTRVSSSARLEQSRSGVEAAQAMLEGARNRLEQAKAQLDSARADVEQEGEKALAAEALSTKANADLERAQALSKTGVISKQELDSATARAAEAKATWEAEKRKVAGVEADRADSEAGYKVAVQSTREAESRLAQAKSQQTDAESAPHQIAAAESTAVEADAQVAQAESLLRQAELDLSYTNVAAPVDGVVTKKSVEAGDYVAVGQSLFALVTSDVYVVANFKETQITNMQPGQKATIGIDAYPGLEIKGHVDSIQRGTGARFSLLPAENATGNYVKVVQRIPVKIVFDENPDPKYLLGPGMSADPTVTVK